MSDLSLVLRAVTEHAERAPDSEMYRDYREGRHRFDFASRKFRESNGWVLRSAQENLCPAVIRAHTNLLHIDGWGDDEAADVARDEGLGRLQRLVHTEAHTTGDAYAITWKRPDTGQPMAVFHRSDQCVPIVDEEQPDQLTAMVKLWIDPVTKLGRANVYTAQTLTRWATARTMQYVDRDHRGMTQMPTFPDASSVWRQADAPGLPHLETHDFGTVPAVWWKRDAPSQFEHGTSVLAPVLPLQDELNKLKADAIVGSERIVMPVRYIMDVAPELLQPKLNSQTGKLEPPKLPFADTDTLLAMTAKGPAGQFPGPAAESIVTLQANVEQQISRVTGVPAFYFSQTSGDVPSGESLRVLASRLTAAVTAFQRDNTPAWRGQAQLLGIAEPVIDWAEPLPVTEQERLANAQAERDLGMPADVWLRTAGYDPDAIDESGATLVQRVELARQTTTQDAASAFYAGAEPYTYTADR